MPPTTNPPLPSPSQSPLERATSLLALLSAHSQGDYIGESISQLEHGLQCADLAAQAGSSKTVTTAALLHDVGQFLPYSVLSSSQDDTPYGRPSHATLGASYLASLNFPQALTFLVASHVTAKRYLAATDPAYVPGSKDCKLSEASVKSLEMQGGPMSAEEVREWEMQEGWEEAIMLRRWDDEAKVVGKSVPGLGAYRDGMARVLAGSENERNPGV